MQTIPVIPIIEGHSELESISSPIGETLNPNVPEFVPTELIMEANNESILINESRNPKSEDESEKVKNVSESANSIGIPYSNNNSLPNNVEIDNKLITTVNSSTLNDPLEAKINEKLELSKYDVWQKVTIFLIFFFQ